MSNRAISAVIDYGQLKGPHLALMLVIADGMDKDTDQYHAKIATLARQCHCSERAVQRSILSCLRAGELIVQEGMIYPNTFYIPIYEGEPGYHPMPCESTTHTCTKYHTPLTVSREEARADDVKQARAAARRAYPQRGDGSVTRRGDGSVTPGVTEVSPQGDGSGTPPVTEVAPFTPSLTPSLTPVVTGGLTQSKKKGTGQSAERTPPTPPTPSPAPAAAAALYRVRDADLKDWRGAFGLWGDVRSSLRAAGSISAGQDSSWLAPVKLYRSRTVDGAWLIVCPSTAVATYLRERYAGRIAVELQMNSHPHPADMPVDVLIGIRAAEQLEGATA